MLVGPHKDNTLLAVRVAIGGHNVQAKDVNQLPGGCIMRMVNISMFKS